MEKVSNSRIGLALKLGNCMQGSWKLKWKHGLQVELSFSKGLCNMHMQLTFITTSNICTCKQECIVD